jgi:hypothetical protein
MVGKEGFILYVSCPYDRPLNASDNRGGGGHSRFLQNIGAYVQDYMASHCREQY